MIFGPNELLVGDIDNRIRTKYRFSGEFVRFKHAWFDEIDEIQNSHIALYYLKAIVMSLVEWYKVFWGINSIQNSRRDCELEKHHPIRRSWGIF